MSVDSVKKMVKKISDNYHLPYFTITPTFSICPIHGYLSGEHEYCPKCDMEIEQMKIHETSTSEPEKVSAIVSDEEISEAENIEKVAVAIPDDKIALSPPIVVEKESKLKLNFGGDTNGEN